MKKSIYIFVLLCVLGLMTINAQVKPTKQNSSDDKPVVTTLMSKKLANSCRNNPQTMGMLLARSTGAETTSDLRWKLLLMDEGAPEICEKLLWDLFEITDPLFQENLQSIGFDYSEITLSNKLIAYLKEEKDKQEKTLRERIIAQEDSLFNVWSKNGVPEYVSPNVPATIICGDTVSFVKYIESLNLDTAINYSLNVEIDEHGEIRGARLLGTKNSNTEYLSEIFNFLQLSAKPAKYRFNNIGKSIDIASVERISVFDNWKIIEGNGFYSDPAKIHLVIKYNRKKQQCKIINNYDENKDYKGQFKKICEREVLDEESVLKEIANYLEQTSYNGKLCVEFYIYQRKLYVKQIGGGIIASGELTPKTIVESVRKVSLSEWALYF